MSQLKLTDVAKINMGQSPSSETYNSEKNGLPFYQGNVDFGEKYPTVRIWCDKPTKIAEPGDILMSVRAPIGALNYANEKCCIGRGLAAITPDPDMTSSEFIYWFLRARHSELNRIGTGSTFKAINRKTLESIEFPKYNKNEQYYIAEILSKIDKTIGEKKAQLEKLDNLIKARFVEMFGDFDLAPQCNEWIKLSKLGEIVSGSTPKTGTAEYWDGDICWITPAELNSMSGIVYDSKKKITEAGRNSCSLRLMPINTVILSSRAPIGKVAILGKEMCCNQGFKNIICNEKILPKYLYYLLAYNTDYLNSLGRGATFKEISKKIVEDIRISLPSIEQQAKFITFSEQVDKSKFALSNELTMGNFYIRLIHDCIMHGSIDL